MVAPGGMEQEAYKHNVILVGFWTNEDYIWLTYEAFKHMTPLTGERPITVKSRIPLLHWIKLSPKEMADIQIDKKLVTWKWHIQSRTLKLSTRAHACNPSYLGG
jgi:hypothetical protein